MGAAAGTAVLAAVAAARAVAAEDAASAGGASAAADGAGAGAAAAAEGGAVALLSVPLEVGNTLLASFALSELLLRGRKVRDLGWLLGVLAALNVSLSPRVHSAAGAALALARAGGGRTASEGPPGASEAPLPPGSAVASSGASLAAWAASRAARGALRTLAASAGFALLAYADVRRMRPQPYGPAAFARELRAALALVLPVFPFLVIGFSFVLLVVVSVFEKIALPEELGDEFIMYGQFYAPFSAVYWIIKRNWISEERSAPILPVASSGAAAAGPKPRAE